MQSTIGNEICYYFNIHSNKTLSKYTRLLENKRIEQIENYQDKLIQMLENHFKTR